MIPVLCRCRFCCGTVKAVDSAFRLSRIVNASFGVDGLPCIRL